MSLSRLLLLCLKVKNTGWDSIFFPSVHQSFVLIFLCIFFGLTVECDYKEINPKKLQKKCVQENFNNEWLETCLALLIILNTNPKQLKIMLKVEDKKLNICIIETGKNKKVKGWQKTETDWLASGADPAILKRGLQPRIKGGGVTTICPHSNTFIYCPKPLDTPTPWICTTGHCF